jgi:ankyrin repeat protein
MYRSIITRCILLSLLVIKTGVNAQESSLHQAVQNGDIKRIGALLNQGCDINGGNEKHDTPLHVAAQYGQTKTVTFLIENNADIDIEGKKYDTPLHLAAEEGHKNIIKILIESNAGINLADERGVTPLHLAAEEGYEKIVNILINNDAEIDVQDEKGATPLHLAVEKGHTSIVDNLSMGGSNGDLNGGANVDIQNSRGFTPLHIAAEQGHAKITEMLMESADPNMPDGEGRNPLHIAVGEGHADTTKALLASRTDVNIPNKMLLTPLHIATINGYLGIVQILIDNGADVNAKEIEGATPLHFAAYHGYEEIVDILIMGDQDAGFNDGANVNALDREDRTPLHIAARYADQYIVEILIKNGANTNAKDRISRFTPLHSAIEGNNILIAQCLLRNCAVITSGRDGDACSHTELAEDGNKYKMIHLLRRTQSANASVQEQLQRGDCVNSIIENGAQPHIVFGCADKRQKEQLLKDYLWVLYNYFYENESALNVISHYSVPENWLAYAVQKGHIDTLSALLEQDCIAHNISKIQDQLGNRALHLAALYNRSAIAKQLLRAGAQSDIVNNDNQTPYDIAKNTTHKKTRRVLRDFYVNEAMIEQVARQKNAPLPKEMIGEIAQYTI